MNEIEILFASILWNVLIGESKEVLEKTYWFEAKTGFLDEEPLFSPI